MLHPSRPKALRWLLLLALALPFVVHAADPPSQSDAWPFASWTPAAENPVFAGTGRDTWDRKIRERGFILVVDGVYHLWYTGYPFDKPPSMSLGHATSRDGVHWTRDPKNPIVADSWVEDVCVVHHDKRFFIFAEGKNDIAHWLTSPDGVQWTEQGPLDIRDTKGGPIPPGPRGTPAAWFENGTWSLLYERGDQGVWLAKSTDLKTWTNVQDDPVLALGPVAYDRAAVAMNQVVKRDGVYYAFYHANSEHPWKDWTTCVARSRDLVHWEKYPGNPIIRNNCSSAILVRTPGGEDRLYTMHPDVKLYRPK